MSGGPQRGLGLGQWPFFRGRGICRGQGWGGTGRAGRDAWAGEWTETSVIRGLEKNIWPRGQRGPTSEGSGPSRLDSVRGANSGGGAGGSGLRCVGSDLGKGGQEFLQGWAQKGRVLVGATKAQGRPGLGSLRG